MENKAFEALSVDELYNLLKLRSEIFVVEQNCVYLDLDGKDKLALHCRV
jgi:ElaA protein